MPDKVFGQADLDDNPAGCVENPSGNSGANQSSLPLGVAVDSQGVVYVADHSNNRVQRFAAAAATGADAEESYVGLNEPHDVAVDQQDNLYIADTLNKQVLVFKDGAVGDLTSDHSFPGLNYPMGMAFSAGGDFLLADCGSPAPASTYPPCINGNRGVYFFAASAPLPPNAVDDAVTTLKNTAASGNVLVNDSDPQGSALVVLMSTQSAHGTVTVLANGDYTYTSATDYVGADSFTYTIRNDAALSDVATVTINVTAEPGGEPAPPNAVADATSTLKNTAVSGNLLVNDSDPQNSPFPVVDSTEPTVDTVTVAANGDFTYTPPTDFLGQATFTYTIRNVLNLTDTATISIRVNEVGETLNEELFMPSLERQ